MIRIFIIATFFSFVKSHSWLECVDYKATHLEHYKLGEFDPNKCQAYPRGFERQFNAGFGVDTGFNWPHEYCNFESSTLKTATFVPGQIVHMSHPAKNHVAEPGCTNQFIPSTSFNVIITPKQAATEDGSFTQGTRLELIGGDHVNGEVDFKGYQRCYQFCDNMDKSHCISSWKIPDDIAEGEYTGLWLWEFNPKEYYSSCFDFSIGDSANNTDIPESNNGSFMSSQSGSKDDPDDTTIQVPNTTMPRPTDVQNGSISDESSGSNTDTPIPSMDIITSDAPSTFNPLITVGKYVLNITGLLNITIALLQ